MTHPSQSGRFDLMRQPTGLSYRTESDARELTLLCPRCTWDWKLRAAPQQLDRTCTCCGTNWSLSVKNVQSIQLTAHRAAMKRVFQVDWTRL